MNTNNERIKACSVEGCGNRRISFADTCGEHAENEAINAALAGLKEKIQQNLYFNELDLEGFTLERITFNLLELQAIDFTNVIFKNCIFSGMSNWTEVYFDQCHLENCTFNDSIFLDVQFRECTLSDLTFSGCEAQHFSWEHSKAENCTFTSGSLSNFSLGDSSGKGIKIVDSVMLMSSFNYVDLENVTFENLTVTKTAFLDVVMRNSTFTNVTHDFDDGIPILMDFYGSSFEEMSIPPNMKVWNNFDHENPRIFYRGIIDLIFEKKTEEDLWYLQLALQHLIKMKDFPSLELMAEVRDYYRDVAEMYKEKNDYRDYGSVISHYMRLVEMFRDNSIPFFPLPSLPRGTEDMKAGMHEGEGSLKITWPSERMNLGDLTTLHKNLGQVYACAITALTGKSFKASEALFELTIQEGKKGSWTELLSGKLPELLLTGIATGTLPGIEEVKNLQEARTLQRLQILNELKKLGTHISPEQIDQFLESEDLNQAITEIRRAVGPDIKTEVYDATGRLLCDSQQLKGKLLDERE